MRICWQHDITKLRLFHRLEQSEVSVEAVTGGNVVAIAYDKEVTESQFVPGTSVEDGYRAMKLADKIVEQIKKATDSNQ